MIGYCLAPQYPDGPGGLSHSAPGTSKDKAPFLSFGAAILIQ